MRPTDEIADLLEKADVVAERLDHDERIRIAMLLRDAANRIEELTYH
jgi:hypothetical protein